MFGEKSQGSIHVLVILFIVSTLIFLSSFISLTHHDVHHPTEHHYQNSREHLLEQSRQQRPTALTSTIPPAITTTTPTTTKKETKPKEAHNTKTEKHSIEKSNKSNKKPTKTTKEKPVNTEKKNKHPEKKHTPSHQENHHPAKETAPNNIQSEVESDISPPKTFIQQQQPRTLRFPSKCHINPHIHYWDEFLEANISPLRAYHGLSAPSEKQKFIVFQPDLGGWNNIRMALEVVILLAKVEVTHIVIYLFILFVTVS